MKHHFIPVRSYINGETFGQCKHCGERATNWNHDAECPKPGPAQGEALKHDREKLPLHLVDPLFLESTATVLQFGARKYGAWNWAKGTFEWSRLYSALQRHALAWWDGEDYDPETGLPHIWHMNCCMMFLTRYVADELGTDDRPYTQSKALCRRDGSAPLPGDDNRGGSGGGGGATWHSILRHLRSGTGSVPPGGGVEPRGTLPDKCLQDPALEQQAREHFRATGRAQDAVWDDYHRTWVSPVSDRQQNSLPPTGVSGRAFPPREGD